jgi:hypothetical protein
LITVQAMCIGFSGTMPVSYLLWMRSMAAIGLMHLIFARRAPASTLEKPVDAAPASRAPQAGFDLGKAVALTAPAPRFPNLMR